MPSRKAPRASAIPGSSACCPPFAPTAFEKRGVDPAVEEVEGEGAEPEAERRRADAADLDPFRAASSKLIALISAPAPKASTSPTWRSGQRRA